MKKNWRIKYTPNEEYSNYRVQRRVLCFWISGNFGYDTKEQAEEAIKKGEWFFEKS